MDPGKFVQRYGTAAFEGQRGATRGADPARQDAAALGQLESRAETARGDREEIPRLLFAEQPARRGIGVLRHFEVGAEPGSKHHLGERHVQAAIGEIMAGSDPATRYQVPHELPVQALEGQVEWRRQPFLAPADLPQIQGAAEPAHALADQNQGQTPVRVR